MADKLFFKSISQTQTAIYKNQFPKINRFQGFVRTGYTFVNLVKTMLYMLYACIQ